MNSNRSNQIHPPTEDKIDVVDLTSGSADPYIICKIPFNVYSKVLQLVDNKGRAVPAKPPVVKQKKRTTQARIKGSWTREEDELLLKIVGKMGPKKWPTIAQQIKGRGGKQCRERYLNHLDPLINHGEFTEEEDQLIMTLYNQYGSQWSKMSRRLAGRPANKIKNRWNSTLSKIVNKNGEEGQPITPKKRKRKKSRKRETMEFPHAIMPHPPSVNIENDLIPFNNESLPPPPPIVIPQLSNITNLGDYSPLNPRRSSRTRKGNKYASPNRSDSSSSSYEIQSPPSSRTYIYPVPESFSIPREFYERRIGNKRKLEDGGEGENSRKRRKLGNESENGFGKQGLNLFQVSVPSYDLENPFPSPLSLEGRSEELYKELIEKNKLVNEMKTEKQKQEEIAILDEKLGIGVSKLSQPENELVKMGFIKNPQYEDLTLSMNDSALFASDYGIELATPSQLTLNLWSPKGELSARDKKGGNGYLRIDIHPKI